MLVENIPDEEIHEIMQRDGDPDYDVIKQRNQKEVQPISYSYKDEYIETLKSQMADLRIQLNDNMKRLDEKDEYIAILKRENERLLNENERLLIALSESQPDELLRKFPFHMGSAEQGLSEQPKI
jgi:chromosomal replication initiation ATPase DnaA